MNIEQPSVGVTLIGAGRIARHFHLPSLVAMPGARVVAVIDPDPAARAAVAQQHPGLVVESSSDLRTEGHDAVVICTPPAFHQPAATAAIEAGLAVYVEKPVSLDADVAATLAQRAEDAGVVAMSGHNFRHADVYRIARDRIATTDIGEVVALRSMVSSAPREVPEWKQHQGTGGSAAADLLIHHLDLLPWLVGRTVQEVSATVRSVRSEADTVVAQLTFGDGLSAACVASSTAARNDTMEIIGTNGTLTIDRYLGTVKYQSSADVGFSRSGRLRASIQSLRGGLRTAWSTGAPPQEQSFDRALRTFIDAVATGSTSPEPTLADGARAVRLLDAVEQSAREGVVVDTRPRR